MLLTHLPEARLKDGPIEHKQYIREVWPGHTGKPELEVESGCNAGEVPAGEEDACD